MDGADLSLTSSRFRVRGNSTRQVLITSMPL
jgi:hypothetical protein